MKSVVSIVQLDAQYIISISYSWRVVSYFYCCNSCSAEVVI